ncbi:MAG: lactonase family protein [Planctomycetota bacterium]
MLIRIYVAFILLGCSVSLAQEAPEAMDVWLGSGSRKPSTGIYHATLNPKFGTLSTPTLVADMRGPGFLAMHPSGSPLYAKSSIDGSTSVAAYAVHRPDGKVSLTLVNTIEIGSPGTAHVAVDATGRMLLTAQYGGSSVAVFALNTDGSIKERTQLIQHEGASKVVPRRQNRPHPHWVGFSRDNRFVFVPDLGLDQVVIYKVNLAASKLTRHGVGVVPPGSGPRHMKFHTTAKWAYVLNELELSVTVFDYDTQAGTLIPKQTVLTVPKEQVAQEVFASASEIRVHPNGRFVYTANRGHDTITAFRVNEESGELTVVEREPIRGATPRNFNIDPTGRWLLAAGQHSHTLTVFAVDQETGGLTYNRACLPVPSPICVLFEHE